MKITKLAKVNESFTINRYDNGFMIEVGGKDHEGDWKNCKIICNTKEDLLEVINQVIAMEMDN
jgi:hypothetical protein